MAPGHTEDVRAVCDRCGRPAVQVNGGLWKHAEYADAVFCQLVMHAGREQDA